MTRCAPASGAGSRRASGPHSAATAPGSITSTRPRTCAWPRPRAKSARWRRSRAGSRPSASAPSWRSPCRTPWTSGSPVAARARAATGTCTRRRAGSRAGCGVWRRARDGAGGREPLLPILDARLRAGVPELHHRLRALAIEVAACAAALGADPLDPALQTIADRCRARLRPLPDLPGLDPPIALTEPSDAEVAAFAARCRPEEGSDDAAW